MYISYIKVKKNLSIDRAKYSLLDGIKKRLWIFIRSLLEKSKRSFLIYKIINLKNNVSFRYVTCFSRLVNYDWEDVMFAVKQGQYFVNK